MSNLIIDILLSQNVALWIYLFIALFMFLESVILIIPSEIIMAVTGYLVYQGRVDLWLSIMLSALGTVLGSIFLYTISRRFGGEVALKVLRRFVTREQLDRAEKMFHRFDKVSVFLAQFIPGIRTLISVPAGIFKMTFSAFVFFTYVGSFMWNLIWIGISYRLGGYTDKVLEVFSLYKGVLLVLFVLVGVVAAVLYFLRSTKKKDRNTC